MPLEPELPYPKQMLHFFVCGGMEPSTPDQVRLFVDGLFAAQNWVIAPPEFSDYPNEPGGVLLIYSALPPVELPLDVDRAHLLEVRALVEAVREFSREHSLGIEFELDGELIGTVKNGQGDKSLMEGLLGEWERNLGA